MTRRSRALAGVAIGCIIVSSLALVAVLLSGRSHREKERSREMTVKILPFDVNEIASLEIDIEGSSCTIQRSAAGWRITQPVVDATDGTAVAALLGALSKLMAGRIATETDERSDFGYGIDPPRARISLISGAGKKLVLLVGARGKFPDVLYLQIEGRPDILYVAGEFEKVLLKDSFSLRRKRLLPFEPRQLNRLILKINGKIKEFQSRGQRWWMLRPERGPADQAAVGRMVTTLHALRAVAFPDLNRASNATFGLDPPEITADLFGPDDRPLARVILGSVKKPDSVTRFYARCVKPPGPLAEIREYQFRNLSRVDSGVSGKTKTGSSTD